MEIQVKDGGTSLHKTIREINLVFKGLIKWNIELNLVISGIIILSYPKCVSFLVGEGEV